MGFRGIQVIGQPFHELQQQHTGSIGSVSHSHNGVSSSAEKNGGTFVMAISLAH